MQRITRSLAVALTIVATGAFMAAALDAKQDAKKDATVDGRWTMTVDGGAHGMTTMGLSLKQEGTKIAGTFASPHGDVPIEGEFTGRTLKVATTGTSEIEVSFVATLKDDGTLSGFMSSAMGDMKWTATRQKEK